MSRGAPRVGVFGDDIPDLTVGLVFALAFFVLDHAALLVEFGLVDGAQQVPMRSDSSQSTRSSALTGTVWK